MLGMYLDVPYWFQNPLLLPICALMQDRVLDLLFRVRYHRDVILCCLYPAPHVLGVGGSAVSAIPGD